MSSTEPMMPTSCIHGHTGSSSRPAPNTAAAPQSRAATRRSALRRVASHTADTASSTKAHEVAGCAKKAPPKDTSTGKARQCTRQMAVFTRPNRSAERVCGAGMRGRPAVEKDHP